MGMGEDDPDESGGRAGITGPAIFAGHIVALYSSYYGLVFAGFRGLTSVVDFTVVDLQTGKVVGKKSIDIGFRGKNVALESIITLVPSEYVIDAITGKMVRSPNLTAITQNLDPEMNPLGPGPMPQEEEELDPNQSHNLELELAPLALVTTLSQQTTPQQLTTPSVQGPNASNPAGWTDTFQITQHPDDPGPVGAAPSAPGPGAGPSPGDAPGAGGQAP